MDLKNTYLMHKRQGLCLNINCGYLRSIGKTEFLKELILEYNQQKQVGTQVFLVVKDPNSFRRYWHNIPIQIITPSILRQNVFFNGAFFADEVPEAEDICIRKNFNFIAGFYSICPHNTTLLPNSQNMKVKNKKFDFMFGNNSVDNTVCNVIDTSDTYDYAPF